MTEPLPDYVPGLSSDPGLSSEGVRSLSGVGVIHKLSSNENPLGPSPTAVAAIREAAATAHLYPPRDDDELCEALAAVHGVDADRVVTAGGAYEVLDLIARALLEPGDEVVVAPPTFGVYARTARLEGAEVVAVTLEPTTFSLRVDTLLEAVTARTRIVYVCNPNNPTGSLTTGVQLDALLMGLPEHVVVVADEVYRHYASDERVPDSMGHVLAGRPMIVTRSFSKAYGLAGLRLGYALTTPALAGRLRRYRRAFHLSTLAIRAGLAALGDTEHLRSSVMVARQGKRYLYRALSDLGVAHWPSEANFVLIRPDRPAEQIYRELLAHGVMVRPTASNGLPDCLRVSVGLPEANRAFVRALRAVLGVE